jgi:putative ABC transport system permease protein
MHNVRYGIRALRNSPGFAIVAVLTLALGIGANTAIFSVVHNVLLRPLPYTQPDRLVEIWNTYPPQVPRAGLSAGDYADWSRQAASFSEMGAYSEISIGFNLTGEAEPQRIQAGYASASLFRMLGLRPVVGRSFPTEEDRAGSAPVAMLSHSLWQSRFGADPSVVGRTINLDDRRYTVIGVLPPELEIARWADLWLPLGAYPDDLTSHIHHGFVAIGRLKPVVTLAQARDEITRLNRQEAIAYPDTHKNFGVLVQRLEDPSAGELRSTLMVLFGAVGLVLLIGCANIVNLLLVRNAAREREIAVRTALGANPWHLTAQMLIESLLLSIPGGLLGLALALFGLKLAMRFVPANLFVLQPSRLNSAVLIFTAAVVLLAGIATGMLPALRARITNLAGVLKQGSKGSSARSRQRTHNVLVISEVAMALVLLTGAGLLLRSLQHLLEVDPGFRADHLLMMEVPHAAISFADYAKLSEAEQTNLGVRDASEFQQIATQVQALPGVKAVGGVNQLPLGTVLRSASRFVIEGQPLPAAGARPIAQTRSISLGYFPAVGIPLLSGRSFVPDDWKLQNALINQTMARRYWPNGDALGKRIDLCSLAGKPCWFSVIGIVGNVHQFGLEAAPTFDLYVTGGWPEHLVIRTETDPASLVAAVTNIVHTVDPKLPVTHVVTMDELLSDSVAQRRVSAALVVIFAVMALILAAVGIYGVLSYAVSQRTQEIGIRMAVGAQRGDVQKMILGHTLKLTVIGIGLGALASLGLTRFLRSLLFGVNAHDPATLAGVSCLLMAVALAAAYVPAQRAVRVDPLAALRCE